MPTEVEIPDIGTIEFPDDMSEDAIDAAIQKILAEEKVSQPAPSPYSRQLVPPEESVPLPEAAADTEQLGPPNYGDLATLTMPQQPRVEFPPLAPDPQFAELARQQERRITVPSTIAGPPTPTLPDLGLEAVTGALEPEGPGQLKEIYEKPFFDISADIESGANTEMPWLTIPISAGAKLVGGISDYFLSLQGASELMGAKWGPRILKFPILVKWAYDMLKGGIESVEGAKTTLNEIITDQLAKKMVSYNDLGLEEGDEERLQEQIQTLVDQAVAIPVMFLGSFGAGKHAVAELKHLELRRPSKPTKIGGTSASTIEKAAKVYGFMRTQPRQSPGKVSVEGGGAGVRGEAEGVAEETPVLLEPKVKTPVTHWLGQTIEYWKPFADVEFVRKMDGTRRRQLARSLGVKNTPTAIADKIKQRLGQIETHGLDVELSDEANSVIDAERAAIDAGIELVDELPSDPNQPFGVEGGGTRVMTIDRRGNKILVNRAEFQDWLDSVPKARRAKAAKSALWEEKFHLMTDAAAARVYWNSLSSWEQALEQKIYTGFWGEEAEIHSQYGKNPELWGQEALRRRLQQMHNMDPTEIAGAALGERISLKALHVFETGIRGMREYLLRTKASQAGVAELNVILGNVELAKKAIIARDRGQEPEGGQEPGMVRYGKRADRSRTGKDTISDLNAAFEYRYAAPRTRLDELIKKEWYKLKKDQQGPEKLRQWREIAAGRLEGELPLELKRNPEIEEALKDLRSDDQPTDFALSELEKSGFKRPEEILGDWSEEFGSRREEVVAKDPALASWIDRRLYPGQFPFREMPGMLRRGSKELTRELTEEGYAEWDFRADNIVNQKNKLLEMMGEEPTMSNRVWLETLFDPGGKSLKELIRTKEGRDLIKEKMEGFVVSVAPDEFAGWLYNFSKEVDAWRKAGEKKGLAIPEDEGRPETRGPGLGPGMIRRGRPSAEDYTREEAKARDVVGRVGGKSFQDRLMETTAVELPAPEGMRDVTLLKNLKQSMDRLYWRNLEWRDKERYKRRIENRLDDMKVEAFPRERKASLLRSYQKAAEDVAARTTYGQREETTKTRSYVGIWSNSSADWFAARDPVKSGETVQLDANQVLIEAPSLMEANAIARNLPELGLAAGSFERGGQLKRFAAELDPNSAEYKAWAEAFGEENIKMPSVETMPYVESFMDHIGFETTGMEPGMIRRGKRDKLTKGQTYDPEQAKLFAPEVGKRIAGEEKAPPVGISAAEAGAGVPEDIVGSAYRPVSASKVREAATVELSKDAPAFDAFAEAVRAEHGPAVKDAQLFEAWEDSLWQSLMGASEADLKKAVIGLNLENRILGGIDAPARFAARKIPGPLAKDIPVATGTQGPLAPKAQPLELEGLFASKKEQQAFEKEVTKLKASQLKGNQYRYRVISELAQALIRQATAKRFTKPITRTSIGINDKDVAELDAAATRIRELGKGPQTPEVVKELAALTKRQTELTETMVEDIGWWRSYPGDAWRDVSLEEAANPDLLGPILTPQARVKGGLVSDSNSLAVLINRESGKVHIVQAHRDPRRGVLITDPNRPHGLAPVSVPIADRVGAYRTIKRILLNDPVSKDFHQTFPDIEAFNKAIGSETNRIAARESAQAPHYRTAAGLEEVELTGTGPLTDAEAGAVFEAVRTAGDPRKWVDTAKSNFGKTKALGDQLRAARKKVADFKQSLRQQVGSETALEQAVAELKRLRATRPHGPFMEWVTRNARKRLAEAKKAAAGRKVNEADLMNAVRELDVLQEKWDTGKINYSAVSGLNKVFRSIMRDQDVTPTEAMDIAYRDITERMDAAAALPPDPAVDPKASFTEGLLARTNPADVPIGAPQRPIRTEPQLKHPEFLRGRFVEFLGPPREPPARPQPSIPGVSRELTMRERVPPTMVRGAAPGVPRPMTAGQPGPPAPPEYLSRAEAEAAARRATEEYPPIERREWAGTDMPIPGPAPGAAPTTFKRMPRVPGEQIGGSLRMKPRVPQGPPEQTPGMIRRGTIRKARAITARGVKAASGLVTDWMADPLGAYSGWMVDRIRDTGSPEAQAFADKANISISREQQLYGRDLTPVLDPARKAAGAQNKGTRWFHGVKAVEGVPDAGIGNAVRGIEGVPGGMPAQAKPIAMLAQIANLEIGRLYEWGGRKFEASGKFQRNLNALGYDIIRQGGGELWDTWTKAIAALNDKQIDQVQNFFKHWKEVLDENIPDFGKIESVNQDFHRQFGKVPTHLMVPDFMGIKAWKAIMHADLFGYLEAAARRATHVRAFREQWPDTDVGLKAFMDEREALKGKLDATHIEILDSLTRALQGHPTDSYSRTGFMAAGRSIPETFRFVNQTVGNLAAKMVLTGQMFLQPGEVIIGSTPVYLGYRNYLRAMAALRSDYKQIYSELEKNGAVNRVIYDFSIDPKFGGWLRSGSRFTGNVLDVAFFEQKLNELQEVAAAATARVVSERIIKKQLTSWEKRQLPQTFQAMGFSYDQMLGMMKGDRQLLDQFERKAAAFLTSGNKAIAQGSRLGANRLFNSIFRFQSYPMMKANQFRRSYMQVIDAFKNGSGRDRFAASEQLARFFVGNALQGVLTHGILQLFYSQIFGTKVSWEQAKDEPFMFAMDSMVAAMGGPFYLLYNSMRNAGTGSITEGLARLVFPYSIGKEIADMHQGRGRYKDKDTMDKIAEFANRKIPGTRAISTGMSIFGLSKRNHKLETSKQAFYRWRRDYFSDDEPGAPSRIKADEDFRIQMVKATKALGNGDRAGYEAALDKAFGLKGNFDDINAALIGRKILKNVKGQKLTPDEMQALQKRIGIDAVQQLEDYDILLENAAKGLVMEPMK